MTSNVVATRKPTRPLSRRQALQAAAALLVVGCGGGGGADAADPGGTGSPPANGAAGPSGWLVYRNSGQAEAFDFTSGRATSFDPGVEPFVDPGMSVAPGRLAIAAQDGDNNGFAFAIIDVLNQRRGLYTIDRAFATQTSAVMFDGTGTRIALSVNEPTSDLIDARIDRTLILEWPSLSTLAFIDGFEEPVWARNSGELLVREPESGRLRVVGPALDDRGWLADVVVAPSIGAYDVSPDGRFVVFDDQERLVGYDRQQGERWIVADRISSLRSPCFSPDGRHLAMHALDMTSANPYFTTYTPHVVPFVRAATVTVDSALHGLASNLVETSGRIGWAA
jgi:hypothetical protein